MKKILTLIAVSCNLIMWTQNQEQQASGNHKHRLFGFRRLDDTASIEKSGIFVLPLIYYTPDTRWAFGAAGVYYFKLDARNENEHETRMSNVQFLADYTQNRQLDVWGIWNIFTRNEDYLLKGELRFRDFPDRFYGIGNNTRKEDEELYSYSLISLKSLVLKQVRPALFFGFDYHLEKEYDFTYTRGAVLEQNVIPGASGGVGSALGLVGVFDNRDNVINAYLGRLAEVSTYFYLPALGSTFTFTYFNLLYHEYWRVKRNRVLAFQGKLRLGKGHIPFLDMSTVGNDDLLRGYAKNRFRDHNFAGAQVEYRFPLIWRFGGVLFAGAGDVFAKPSDLRLDLIKPSVGGGLRFVINPAERLNIRLDYGYGKEGGQFYFVIAEAF